MCWINTVDPQAGQIVYSLAMIILPMVTVTCYCYMDLYLILFVKQNYSIIFVHSSNNICVEVPLFRYLCQGASVDPHRAARQLPLRLPGGWAGSRCVSVKIFFGKVSKYQTESTSCKFDVFQSNYHLSPGCFGSHQMSWLKNTLIAIVKTVDYQNNPGSLASSISYLVLWKASSRGVGRAGHHQTGSAATSKAPSFPQSGFNPFTTHFLCN